MNKSFNLFKSFVSLIFGFICSMLGGYDVLLHAILTLIVIDYITGLLKGATRKELDSKVGFIGIIKKVMILFVIATSVVISSLIEMDTPIREITIMFFIVNESLSILENAGNFLPIPEKLKNLILQLKE